MGLARDEGAVLAGHGVMLAENVCSSSDGGWLFYGMRRDSRKLLVAKCWSLLESEVAVRGCACPARRLPSRSGGHL